MPTYVLDLIKQLGFLTPFVYAAGTYGFFHYLDKQASAQAKTAISGWFKPLEYDRAAVAAATVEIFDRLYTRPLLGWRAALRSALFTVVLTAIFVYEVAPSAPTFVEDRYRGITLYFLIVSLLTYIVSDYISLFIVRRFLLVGSNRPLISLVGGSLLGTCVVGLFAIVRIGAVMIWVWLSLGRPVITVHAWTFLIVFFGVDSLFISLPALAVHLWLPVFAFGILCVTGLNYLFLAIGGMQWFLKRGNDHPLDAVGYVLGFLVFVGTGILQLVR
jgi:hypothetical protein